MAGERGLCFSPLQIGRPTSAQGYTIPAGGASWKPFTLPDVTIWTAPGQHHEIKHKAPTPDGCFGLEVYRFRALLDFAAETQQAVFYTIHNHALNGGRDNQANYLAHWLTVNVMDLEGCHAKTQPGSSWVNGKRVDGIMIHYWRVTLWTPLAKVLTI
jgi:hypothetical protein